MSEAENTFRALKGQELLVTRFGCRIGWHMWEKYKDPQRMIEGGYNVTYQTRVCGYCNLQDLKVLRKE